MSLRTGVLHAVPPPPPSKPAVQAVSWWIASGHQSVLFLPREEGGLGLVHLEGRGATFRLQFGRRRRTLEASSPEWFLFVWFGLAWLAWLSWLAWFCSYKIDIN